MVQEPELYMSALLNRAREENKRLRREMKKHGVNVDEFLKDHNERQRG